LPQTDPQYQGIQGFNFGDFPSLGGGVSKDTNANVTEGAGEAPAEDIGIVKSLEEEIKAGSKMTPDPKGKAKEHTAAVEGVPHIPAPALSAGAPAAPTQQISRPSLFRGSRFSTKDMADLGRAPSSGVLRLRRVRSKPRFTMILILIGLTI
jgi:hypothetical protein